MKPSFIEMEVEVELAARVEIHITSPACHLYTFTFFEETSACNINTVIY